MPAERKSRQEVVESLLRKIVKQPDFPAFAEHITEVMQTVDKDETSLRHITNTILKDFSLTMKVLRTANSPYYNRSGRSIVTVTHAVALLGLDAIRDLAGTMLLLKHYKSRSSGIRELMLLSLLTASHARATAARVGYPRIEEAYLCGMFRNLGEALLAGYLPRRYAAILKRMRELGVSEHAACLRIVGCSYEDLGQAAARYWKMPDVVQRCISPSQPRLTKAVNSELDILQAITSFSHGLTEAVHRRDPKVVRGRLNYLLMTHGAILSLGRREIESITAEAIADTKATFSLLQMPLDDLRLRKQSENAIRLLDEDENAVGESDAPAGLAVKEDLLERLTDEVDLVLSSSRTVELTNLMLMILEALYRGVPADRVVFGLVNSSFSHVRGRLGLGDKVEELLRKFEFPLTGTISPVSLAFRRKQSLVVYGDRFQGSDLCTVTGATAFALHPVVVDNVAVGCLYLDWKKLERPVRAEARYWIERLQELAGEAIRSSRNGDRG